MEWGTEAGLTTWEEASEAERRRGRPFGGGGGVDDDMEEEKGRGSEAAGETRGEMVEREDARLGFPPCPCAYILHTW